MQIFIIISMLLVFLVVAFPPILGGIVIPLFYACFPRKCTVTSEPIVVTDSWYNPANEVQNEANVWMSTSTGNVYFHPRWCDEPKWRTEYYQYLCVFNKGDVQKIVKLKDQIHAMNNGYFYYNTPARITSNGVVEDFYYYDIQAKKSVFLLTSDGAGVAPYGEEDGTFYVPSNENGTTFRAINQKSVSAQTFPPMTYTLNGNTYEIVGKFYDTEIICTDPIGNKHSMRDSIPRGRKSLIPCEQGLLIHNEGQGELLYLISSETGDVVELFSVPCILSHSAVNIHENFVYISVSRYKFDEKTDATVPYENDILEGTYRINLLDYSVQRISRTVYTGLFIFDDTGIYACDEYCRIVKLDFEGNIVLRVME